MYKLSEPKHDDYKRFIIEYDLIVYRQNEVVMYVHFFLFLLCPRSHLENGGQQQDRNVYIAKALFLSIFRKIFKVFCFWSKNFFLAARKT